MNELSALVSVVVEGADQATLNFWDPLSHAKLFGKAKTTIKHTRTDGWVLVSFEIFFH